MYDFEDYEPTQEEMEEYEGDRASEANTDMKTLEVKFDVENFALGIATEVKRTLKKELLKELKSGVIADLKDEIQKNIHEISYELVKEVYEKETVCFGWGTDKKEMSVKDYILNQIQTSFVDGKFKSKTKDSWGNTKITEVSLQDYINSKITFDAVQKDIDREIDSIRKDINRKIKDIFDTSTRQMLADNVVQVLMANETYQKIQSNVACIADRKEQV